MKDTKYYIEDIQTKSMILGSNDMLVFEVKIKLVGITKKKRKVRAFSPYCDRGPFEEEPFRNTCM